MDKQEMWRQRMVECEASEQSITEWCRENGININTLNYWRKRFKHEKESVSFVEVKKSRNNTCLSQNIELCINGAVIQVTSQTDMKLLKEVVEVLNAQHR